MKMMSDWSGFDADKNDKVLRNITINEVEGFYQLFWLEKDQEYLINRMIELGQQLQQSLENIDQILSDAISKNENGLPF